MTTIRCASHAGSWYSDDEKVLSSSMERWSKDVEQSKEDVKGIIVPHAGYRFCGETSGKVFGQVRGKSYKYIFVLGPLHHFRTQKCLLSQMNYYSTPFGNVPVANDINLSLYETGHFDYIDTYEEENEHSIEMEIPFIKYFIKEGYQIIPIYVGQVLDNYHYIYAQCLSEYMSSSDALFVISSDFTHWGERFRYTYLPDTSVPIYEGISRGDMKAVKSIEKQDPQSFWEYIEKTKITICGRHAIDIYLTILSILSLPSSTKLIHYAQSSQVESSFDSSVSYCSIITKLST
ncbi:hypothetical protein WA158_004398 [Blastocystis sp. Blastoise]